MSIGAIPSSGGVEAAIWGETTTSLSDVQFMILPRLPGVAENAWSASAPEWADYSGRLRAQEAICRARGWNFFRSPLVFSA